MNLYGKLTLNNEKYAPIKVKYTSSTVSQADILNIFLIQQNFLCYYANEMKTQ